MQGGWGKYITCENMSQKSANKKELRKKVRIMCSMEIIELYFKVK